jgi:hypothetical protein
MEGESSRDVEELHELPSVDMGLASSPKVQKNEDMSLDDVVYELSELGESVSDLHTESVAIKSVDTHIAEKRAYRKKMRRMRTLRRMRHEVK